MEQKNVNNKRENNYAYPFPNKRRKTSEDNDINTQNIPFHLKNQNQTFPFFEPQPPDRTFRGVRNMPPPDTAASFYPNVQKNRSFSNNFYNPYAYKEKRFFNPNNNRFRFNNNHYRDKVKVGNQPFFYKNSNNNNRNNYSNGIFNNNNFYKKNNRYGELNYADNMNKVDNKEEVIPTPPLLPDAKDICNKIEQIETKLLALDEDLAKLTREKEELLGTPVPLRDYKHQSKIRFDIYQNFSNLIIRENIDKMRASQPTIKIEKSKYKDPKDYPFYESNRAKHKKFRPLLCKVLIQRKTEMKKIISDSQIQLYTHYEQWKDYLVSKKQGLNKNGTKDSSRRITRSKKNQVRDYRIDSSKKYISSLAVIPPMNLEMMNMIYIDNNRKLIDTPSKLEYLKKSTNWSTEEEKKFVQLFKQSPKDFDIISRLMNKTNQDCIEFYYRNKFRLGL